MITWQKFFEVVAVPVSGLLLVFLAALGGPVPETLYPLIAGMIGFPVVREWDRRRRNGGNGQ